MTKESKEYGFNYDDVEERDREFDLANSIFTKYPALNKINHNQWAHLYKKSTIKFTPKHSYVRVNCPITEDPRGFKVLAFAKGERKFIGEGGFGVVFNTMDQNGHIVVTKKQATPTPEEIEHLDNAGLLVHPPLARKTPYVLTEENNTAPIQPESYNRIIFNKKKLTASIVPAMATTAKKPININSLTSRTLGDILEGCIEKDLSNSVLRHISSELVAEKHYTFMHNMGTSIYTQLSNKQLDLNTRLHAAIETAWKLHTIHTEKKVTHGDIKPGNVLINENKHVNIIDYGSARSLEDKKINSLPGTLKYQPENKQDFNNLGPVGRDVFALRRTIYMPKDGKDGSEKYINILNADDNLPQALITRFDTNTTHQNVINQCKKDSPLAIAFDLIEYKMQKLSADDNVKFHPTPDERKALICENYSLLHSVYNIRISNKSDKISSEVDEKIKALPEKLDEELRTELNTLKQKETALLLLYAMKHMELEPLSATELEKYQHQVLHGEALENTIKEIEHIHTAATILEKRAILYIGGKRPWTRDNIKTEMTNFVQETDKETAIKRLQETQEKYVTIAKNLHIPDNLPHDIRIKLIDSINTHYSKDDQNIDTSVETSNAVCRILALFQAYDEGVYIQHMTEADGMGNTAENSSAESIPLDTYVQDLINTDYTITNLNNQIEIINKKTSESLAFENALKTVKIGLRYGKNDGKIDTFITEQRTTFYASDTGKQQTIIKNLNNNYGTRHIEYIKDQINRLERGEGFGTKASMQKKAENIRAALQQVPIEKRSVVLTDTSPECLAVQHALAAHRLSFTFFDKNKAPDLKKAAKAYKEAYKNVYSDKEQESIEDTFSAFKKWFLK